MNWVKIGAPPLRCWLLVAWIAGPVLAALGQAPPPDHEVVRDLDVNGDGVADFRIAVGPAAPTQPPKPHIAFYSVPVRLKSLGDGQLLLPSTNAACLSAGDGIGSEPPSGSSWDSGAEGLDLETESVVVFPDFNQVQITPAEQPVLSVCSNPYFGFRIPFAQGWRYGWFQLQRTNSTGADAGYVSLAFGDFNLNPWPDAPAVIGEQDRGLDVDGDGVADFRIAVDPVDPFHGNIQGPVQFYFRTVRLEASSGSQLLLPSADAACLAAGASVSSVPPTACSWDTTQTGLYVQTNRFIVYSLMDPITGANRSSTQTVPVPGPLLATCSGHYLGCRVRSQGGWRYGWLQLRPGDNPAFPDFAAFDLTPWPDVAAVVGEIARPPLSIGWEGGIAELSWPPTITHYILVGASTPDSRLWIPVAGVQSNRVALPVGAPAGFFQLVPF